MIDTVSFGLKKRKNELDSLNESSSEKPRIKGFLKKTGTVLDWTLLPIREIGSLWRSIKLLFLSLKNIGIGLYMMINKSMMDLENSSKQKNVSKISWFKTTFKYIIDKEEFYRMLKPGDFENIKNLDNRFFLKSKAYIWASILLLACGCAFFYLNVGTQISIFRGTLNFILIFLFGLLTWYKACILENIIYAKNRMEQGGDDV